METSRVAPARRILLAVDLTNASAGAIEEAIRVAAADGGEIIVLGVVEPSNLHLPGGGSRRVDQERDRLETGVREIVRRARAAGVRAMHLIWEGDPAEAILDAAIAESVDVIVLGSRRRTNIRRLLLGSVSGEVSRTASCRVVVVGT